MNQLSGGTSGAGGISVGYKSNNSSLGGSENAGQRGQAPPVDGAAGEGNFFTSVAKASGVALPSGGHNDKPGN